MTVQPLVPSSKSVFSMSANYKWQCICQIISDLFLQQNKYCTCEISQNLLYRNVLFCNLDLYKCKLKFEEKLPEECIHVDLFNT